MLLVSPYSRSLSNEPIVDAFGKPPPAKGKGRLYNKSVCVTSRIRYNPDSNVITEVQKPAVVKVKQWLEYRQVSVLIERLCDPDDFAQYKKSS